MGKWQESFPNMMFRPKHHCEVSDVIRRLPLEKIVGNDDDASHIATAEHAICDFYAPFGILCVA